MKNENIDFQQDEPNLMHNLIQLNEVIVRIYISLGKLKNVKIEKEGFFIKKFDVEDNLLVVDYDIMEIIHYLRSNYYPLSGTLEFDFHMVKSDQIYFPHTILSYLGFLKRLEKNLPKEHAFVLSEIFPDQIYKVKFIEYKMYGMFQSIYPDVTVDKEFKLNINRDAAFIKKTDPIIEKITKASNKKFAQYIILPKIETRG
ncbi:hypothetical protein Belba_2149 [Belliella baltica DSM 15883]|uniref:Uncharacterized protein n=1 Tax=Belliella baltica (strain DSM 15883 / CIP 108006 / LMG 21964 / BA134) TaxID=866536 RepID=I3Z648_BELBD|nr:hypothetical protein [Belliella baltica]AFL84716.1 hypothetical protein Belba_2149 [Belliella baltica DSM 15883]